MSVHALDVRRLGPALADDYLAFFDHERGPAFADNPEWAKCYCHYYHVPKVVTWSEYDGNDNRTAMRARIESGEMDGFLAYADGGVVGWVNAQPYHKLRHACARLNVSPAPLPVPPQDAAAIVCFVVAPGWRRRGVSKALLAAALASFTARGIRYVDAFPWKSGDSTDATDHYHGSLSMFRAAGFVEIGDAENLTIVRKTLAPAA
jgi:ribosomal protein S18 acetylase RimI-like enzyme